MKGCIWSELKGRRFCGDKVPILNDWNKGMLVLFFSHRNASTCYKTNKFHSLKPEEDIVQRRVIHNHILHHFLRLLRQNNSFWLRMKEGAWNPLIDMRDLEVKFFEEEIKRMVWELGPDKALVSDGFLLFSLGYSGKCKWGFKMIAR